MSGHVLVVDDEQNYLVILRQLLERSGYGVETAATPLEALKLAARRPFDAALVDLRLGELDGMEVLDRLKRMDRDLGVVIMTAYATVETAVESLKRGAGDYVMKPFDNAQLLRALERTVAMTRLARENARLREAVRVEDTSGELVGSSPALEEIRRLIQQVGSSDSTVLITGETGTGKEVVARALHAASPRADQPFVPVHCAALSESVLESELFGHERGAFTGAVARKRGRFELAHGGTLFLDEVGEISEAVQIKLLRAIETRTFERVGGEQPIESDARFVAATNREIESDVKAGRFREDLYYRLNVVRIRIPPLRERKMDIAALAQHFLARYAARRNLGEIELDPRALERLMSYPWPGNVRELENVLERAVVISPGPRIEPEALPDDLRSDPGGPGLGRLARKPLQEAIEQFERELILHALEANEYVQARAAEQLGLSRSALHYKLSKHGIRTPRR
ncbi:MAG: sigma-54-dependent transcriptional regulator [Myxococcota bacterium]